MKPRLYCAVLGVFLSCLTGWAQKPIDYRTGLLDVRNASDTPTKTVYLLHVSDVPNEYFALYNPKSPDSDLLKLQTDVQYRVSGKNLFVRIPERQEVTSRLCKQPQFSKSGLGVKCGRKVHVSPDILFVPVYILGVLAMGL